MYFVFQSSIIFAVVASNIHWQWTPNGYLAGAIGVALAYGLEDRNNPLKRRDEDTSLSTTWAWLNHNLHLHATIRGSEISEQSLEGGLTKCGSRLNSTSPYGA